MVCKVKWKQKPLIQFPLARAHDYLKNKLPARDADPLRLLTKIPLGALTKFIYIDIKPENKDSISAMHELSHRHHTTYN